MNTKKKRKKKETKKEKILEIKNTPGGLIIIMCKHN